jgi:hypothetical protein
VGEISANWHPLMAGPEWYHLYTLPKKRDGKLPMAHIYTVTYPVHLLYYTANCFLAAEIRMHKEDIGTVLPSNIIM